MREPGFADIVMSTKPQIMVKSCTVDEIKQLGEADIEVLYSYLKLYEPQLEMYYFEKSIFDLTICKASMFVV